MPNQFLSDEFGDIEDYFVTDYWLIDNFVGDSLWVWGQNTEGRLGDNTTTDRKIPVTTFSGGTNWKQVAGGQAHTAAIKTDGSLWTWGAGTSGQLGNFASTARTTPVTTFAGENNWKQIDCGEGHTVAIKTDGSLWVWGRGTEGQLGNNAATDRNTPVTTFAGGNNWKQVSGGRLYTAAIKTDGTLWTWGGNAYGQLGTNDTTQRNTPVTTFAGGTNWKSVAGGGGTFGAHTAAIKTDGSLWVWGRNSSGQLGDNTTTNRNAPVTTFAGGTNWKQVSCGRLHTAAIKTDGTLWTWGQSNEGQLGNNVTATNRSTPVTTFSGGTNWKQVSCAYASTAATKTDGTLWTWGWNGNGAGILGNNTNFNSNTPITTFAGGTNWKSVDCGFYHMGAIKSGLNVDLS